MHGPGGAMADDQGAMVILAAALMLAYSTISVAIRLQTRWPWRQFYRHEDTVLLLAWAVGIGYTASIAFAVRDGFGLKESLVPQGNDVRINICLSVSFVLFFVAKGLGTASYGMFLDNLTEEDRVHRTVVRAGHIFSLLWIVPAIVTTAVMTPRQDSLPRSAFIVFGAAHAIVLLLLFGSTARMIAAARLPWLAKIRAVLWFGLAPVLVAVLAVRLSYTPDDGIQPRFTQSSVKMIILMIIEMHFNLINAAYPNLLVFVDKTSTKSIHSAPRTRSVFTLPNSDVTSSSARHSDLSLEIKAKLAAGREKLGTADSQRRIFGSMGSYDDFQIG